MLISDSLHNSLVILSLVIFILFLLFVGFKQLRVVWHHINIIYNRNNNRSNILLLNSSELLELRHVLSTVDDEIDIHPRQIRRILRRALDSNIVKDVPISKPQFFIKHPNFIRGNNNEYIFKFNHYIHQQQQDEDDEKKEDNESISELSEEGTMCFDFYFGVPKSYYFQLKSLKQYNIKHKKPIDKEIQLNDNINNYNKELPLQSIINFATNKFQPKMKRIHSKSFQSKSSIEHIVINKNYNQTNEGIEMTEMTEMTEIKNNKSNIQLSSPVITLQKLIPNEYVYHDFVESKRGENISFDENDLETTINTIIGNTKTELIKKHGRQTKYKKQITNNSNNNENNNENQPLQSTIENKFYFCIVFSYIRYGFDGKNGKNVKNDNNITNKKNKKKNIVSNLLRKKTDTNDQTYRKQIYESDESDQSNELNGSNHEFEENKLQLEDDEEEKYDMNNNNNNTNINNKNSYQSIKENGINYRIDTLEISIFDPPSAFQPKNIKHKTNNKNDKKENNDKNDKNDTNILNALEPNLYIKLLCDFNLHRLVEYYDIFGISSDIDNKDINLDCKICFSFPANIILLPCRHCCCCLSCYKHIESCPMCRKPIRQTLRWKYQSDTEK